VEARKPDQRDPLGRPGEAIAIPVPTAPEGNGRLTMIFDPATSALLYWSEDGAAQSERHTVLRSARVAEIGER
jgi:hypothetical protein